MLFETVDSNMSILEYDAFGLLVALTFSLPSLFNGDQAAPLPSGNIQDAHILRMVYTIHLVQILLTTDRFSNDSICSSEPMIEPRDSPTRTSQQNKNKVNNLIIDIVDEVSTNFAICFNWMVLELLI